MSDGRQGGTNTIVSRLSPFLRPTVQSVQGISEQRQIDGVAELVASSFLSHRVLFETQKVDFAYPLVVSKERDGVAVRDPDDFASEGV